jgi:hypothetical protein
MKIQVLVTNVYGKRVIYPADTNALAFAAIAGTKTLTLDAINQIKKLGYAIEVIQQPITI